MKTNLILIGIAITVLSIASVSFYFLQKKVDKLEMENVRLQNNLNQILNDTTHLSTLRLKKDEVIGKYKAERDSALKRLELRPKEILKIVTNTIIERDTIPVPVPVTVEGPDRWFVSDTGKCHIWSGDVYLEHLSLKVWRSDFQYNNDTEIVYYKERPHKVWFFRWGKWVYKEDVSSKCGESYTKEINFIR